MGLKTPGRSFVDYYWAVPWNLLSGGWKEVISVTLIFEFCITGSNLTGRVGFSH
jgi:hypothetical protein